MANPIWKDYYVDFGDLDTCGYTILYNRRELGTTTVYVGQAVRRPGEATLRVKINDICADYIEGQNIEEEDGFHTQQMEFTFMVISHHNGNHVQVEFTNDWSYDYARVDNGVLSDPINGRFDVRMPLLYSISAAQTIYIDAQDTHADFNIDFSADFQIGNDRQWQVIAEAAGTLTLTNIFEEHGDVQVGDIMYHGVTSCARYAIYYINAYGGWDFLLMEGLSVETDSYNRRTRTLNYDNTLIANRGIVNYLNEVSKNYTLRTGWMFGEQGQKMHHLLGSTQVYLFDIENSNMIPVVLTNTDCRYKTYKTEGCKLVDYEVTVRLAQNRVRK